MKKSKLAASLVPYVAGEQPRGSVIKLNTNENPYPPSPRVAQAAAAFDYERLRLYPDPTADELRACLAEYEGVGIENIFVGNGSDEVLSFAFAAFFDAADLPVLFPDVSYSFYKVFCSLYGIAYQEISVREDFSVNIDDYLGKQNSGIVLASPNAPTAISSCEEDIRRLACAYPQNVVILDEAYVDFSRAGSRARLTQELDNLLVVKTFSKSRSLAGGRIGYAVGNKELIDTLRVVKNCFNSYTVNALSAALGKESVLDREYFDDCIKRVVETRERTASALKQLGFEQTTSDANFLFVRHSQISGRELAARLRESGIVIRRFDLPRIEDYLRITIGTEEEMGRLIEECKKILGR